MYVLCFLLLSFWCHDYHDYQHFNLYLQYGTTITPEKTKQAMETIQSVLVEKLDKKFDHVEVSKLFYYIILHIVGKFLLAMWFSNLSEAKTQVSFSDKNKSSFCSCIRHQLFTFVFLLRNTGNLGLKYAYWANSLIFLVLKKYLF